MTLAGISRTYQIDAAKDPMQIDWTAQVGVNYGIIKLDGDELTLCFMQALENAPGNAPPRPTDFSPQPGKIITTFKRQQP
jgi:uncharacterized protein (TIGR03067 family)